MGLPRITPTKIGSGGLDPRHPSTRSIRANFAKTTITRQNIIKQIASIIYGLVAVLLWSTAATVGSQLKLVVSPAIISTSLIAGGAFTFALIAWARKEIGQTGQLARACVEKPSNLIVLVMLGCLVAIYYFCFYYALQNSDPVEANIINYLWPVLFPILGFIFFNMHQGERPFYKYSLLVVASSGAVIIAWNPAANGFAADWNLRVIPFLAAFSAATYLCIAQFKLTEYAISTKYLLSFIIVLPCLAVILVFAPVEWTLKSEGLPKLAYLSIIVFGVGQFSFNEALRIGDKIAISALAYLTPILSTVFLVLFASHSVSNAIAFGGVLILASSILLNDSLIELRAVSSGLAGFLLGAVAVFVQPRGVVALAYDVPAILGLLFAIISGFFLSRLWDKNQIEDGLYADLIAEIRAQVEKGNNDPEKNNLLLEVVNGMIAYFCSSKLLQSTHHIRSIIEKIRTPKSKASASQVGEVHRILERVFIIRTSRLSRAELICVVFFGLATVLALYFQPREGIIDDAFFSAICGLVAFVLALLHDQNDNNGAMTFEKLYPLEDLRIRLGHKPWVPSLRNLVGSWESALPIGTWLVGESPKNAEIINVATVSKSLRRVRFFLSLVLVACGTAVIALLSRLAT